MKKQLEILSVNENLSLIIVNKPELNLNGKSYENIREWRTPYLSIKKKESKFYKKMHNLISKFGKKIGADLAVIKYTSTCYIDNTSNHTVIFYREK